MMSFVFVVFPSAITPRSAVQLVVSSVPVFIGDLVDSFRKKLLSKENVDQRSVTRVCLAMSLVEMAGWDNAYREVAHLVRYNSLPRNTLVTRRPGSEPRKVMQCLRLMVKFISKRRNTDTSIQWIRASKSENTYIFLQMPSAVNAQPAAD